MVVAGQDEDEVPRFRGDDIGEVAPLEEGEHLPGEHLVVELGVADARGAERVVVPPGPDVLPGRMTVISNRGSAHEDTRDPRQ